MSENTVGTSGGRSGTSGTRAKLAWAMAALFAAVLTVITIGNAESSISDFAAAHVPISHRHVWIWEITSVVAWASTAPLIWWAVARMWPPRLGWGVLAPAFVGGLFVASGWHIGVTIVLRKLIYRVWEGAGYRFQAGIANPYLYEFRKDIATYLQFVLLAVICQWLLMRVGAPAPVIVTAEERFLSINDGTATHRLPLAAITTVTAAGNYVEIAAEGRTLLHRATLAAMEGELGPGFVRIHRSRLVNKARIRRIESNQSGDFAVELTDGATVKGSRRYRAGLE